MSSPDWDELRRLAEAAVVDSASYHAACADMDGVETEERTRRYRESMATSEAVADALEDFGSMSGGVLALLERAEKAEERAEKALAEADYLREAIHLLPDPRPKGEKTFNTERVDAVIRRQIELISQNLELRSEVKRLRRALEQAGGVE